MRTVFIAILIFSLTAFSSLQAQEYAVSLKICTLGLQAEVYRSFGEKLNFRLGGAYFKYNFDDQENGNYAYSIDTKLASISAIVDYFPFQNIFRFSGGVLFNFNGANSELLPTQSYTINGYEYTPEMMGSIEVKIKYNLVSPYLGLGIGNLTQAESGISFTFDVGTIFQGVPTVSMAAEGLIKPSASPEQEDTIKENLSWTKWYPILSFGINYKF